MAYDLRPLQALKLWHDVMLALVHDVGQDTSAGREELARQEPSARQQGATGKEPSARQQTSAHHDLSARQWAILLTIYLEPPPHTVRGLAKKLGVTKPVITRALDTLGAQGLVSRRRDEADRRNVVIQRTVDGALAIERLADIIVATAGKLPR